MTKTQENICIRNIQGYLDRIEWLEDGNTGKGGPEKVCDLCLVFMCTGDSKYCSACPLGPGLWRCLQQPNFIYEYQWDNASISQLKLRMNWLLEKYKKAGLDIEITKGGETG